MYVCDIFSFYMVIYTWSFLVVEKLNIVIGSRIQPSSRATLN
jgi:hypothetical protein